MAPAVQVSIMAPCMHECQRAQCQKYTHSHAGSDQLLLRYHMQAVKKLHGHLRAVKEAAVERTLPAVKEVVMAPHARTMDEELDEAALVRLAHLCSFMSAPPSSAAYAKLHSWCCVLTHSSWRPQRPRQALSAPSSHATCHDRTVKWQRRSCAAAMHHSMPHGCCSGMACGGAPGQHEGTAEGFGPTSSLCQVCQMNNVDDTLSKSVSNAAP